MMNKKMFLIFGVVGSICAVNSYANPLIGEVVATANGYMACPPECTFQRNGDGGLASPQMCIDNRDVECGNVVRHYDEYPTQFYVGEDESNNVSKKSATLKNAEKLESTSVARVARAGTQVKKVSANVKPVTPQAVQKVADGPTVGGYCTPASCSPDPNSCAIVSNMIMCNCTGPDGVTCEGHPIGEETNATASVARVAKMGTQLKKTTSVLTNPVVTGNSETENPVEKLKIIYEGNEYACPRCNKFALDGEGNFLLPPRCDGCETVTRNVSQNR